MLLAHKVQHWRLLHLDRKGLGQRSIEDRVSGLVLKVRKNNGVLRRRRCVERNLLPLLVPLPEVSSRNPEHSQQHDCRRTAGQQLLFASGFNAGQTGRTQTVLIVIRVPQLYASHAFQRECSQRPKLDARHLSGSRACCVGQHNLLRCARRFCTRRGVHVGAVPAVLKILRPPDVNPDA